MGEAYKFPSLLVHRIKVEIAPEKMRKASGEGKLMCGAGGENIKTGKILFCSCCAFESGRHLPRIVCSKASNAKTEKLLYITKSIIRYQNFSRYFFCLFPSFPTCISKCRKMKERNECSGSMWKWWKRRQLSTLLERTRKFKLKVFSH